MVKSGLMWPFHHNPSFSNASDALASRALQYCKVNIWGPAFTLTLFRVCPIFTNMELVSKKRLTFWNGRAKIAPAAMVPEPPSEKLALGGT